LHVRFTKASPRILGALLDGVASGLAAPDANRSANSGRMIDMQRFIAACEKVYWPEGTFERAYSQSRQSASAALTEASPVATGVISLIEEQRCFGGTSTDLLRELRARQRNVHVDGKLPGGPAALSSELERIKPLLTAQGIQVERDRAGQRGDRWIEISRAPVPKVRPQKPRPAQSKPVAEMPGDDQLPLLAAMVAEMEPV
jgi:hypothetical protein